MNYDVYTPDQLKQIITDNDEELEWLRFYMNSAQNCLGPASDEIYMSIVDNYAESGKFIPPQYHPDFE